LLPVAIALPMIGPSRTTFPGEREMNYDWTGARARKITLVKWTSLLVVGTAFPLTLLLWLQFSH